MMTQKWASLLFCSLLILSACNKSLPLQMPDFDLDSNELEFNRYIRLTAPPQLNTNKPGKSISLEVENLSKEEWSFNITRDILIYQYENGEWEKISDRMINIGATELLLGPSGNFPMDKRIIGVLPNVKADQPANLRIILLVREVGLENDSQIKGAYVDVLLIP